MRRYMTVLGTAFASLAAHAATRGVVPSTVAVRRCKERKKL